MEHSLYTTGGCDFLLLWLYQFFQEARFRGFRRFLKALTYTITSKESHVNRDSSLGNT